MEQDKTRTLLISCQHWAGLRPAGWNSLRGSSARHWAEQAREGGARGVCRVAESWDRRERGSRRAEERRGQPDTRQGPAATGQGWILTWVRTRQPRDTEQRLVMLRTGTLRHKVNNVKRSLKKYWDIWQSQSKLIWQWQSALLYVYRKVKKL